jgi:hypothetical protein
MGDIFGAIPQLRNEAQRKDDASCRLEYDYHKYEAFLLTVKELVQSRARQRLICRDVTMHGVPKRVALRELGQPRDFYILFEVVESLHRYGSESFVC